MGMREGRGEVKRWEGGGEREGLNAGKEEVKANRRKGEWGE